jgi:glycosyltransferase involved in cell wall biosynthesis
MKVLFLTTSWPSEASPVDGIFVREHALAAATCCDVAVVHLQREAGRGLYEVSPIGGPPPTLRVRYRRFGRPLSYAAFAAGAAAALRRLRRDGFDPDVFHAHSFLSAIAALGPARLLGRPLVYSEHWTIFIPENPGLLSPLQRRLARFALTRADAVLPVSEDLREALAERAPGASFRVVPNAVDEDLFQPPDKPPARDGELRLLAAGLMDGERKGFDLLLEAASRLRAVRDDFRIDVLGDGANRPAYEELARRLGLERTVTFHGLSTKAEVAEAMRRSHLFVLTSRAENNPCVLIEALASGVPVVATRVGGVSELVRPAVGLLADSLDPGDIAEAIDHALERLPEFDRDSMARDARERYGRERIGTELAEVYEECLGRRSR